MGGDVQVDSPLNANAGLNVTGSTRGTSAVFVDPVSRDGVKTELRLQVQAPGPEYGSSGRSEGTVR